MGNFYGSQAQWRMWGVSRLAEREGFEPPIRLPVCRISSAVLSTTQPPLRGRQRRKDVCAGYVSNAGPLNKGGRRRREAGFEPRSQLRAIEIATNQHELVSCLTLL
jgi:hypothetical protein